MQIVPLDDLTKQILCDCGSTDFHVIFKPSEMRLHCKHCTKVIKVRDMIHATKDSMEDLSEAMKKAAEQQRKYRPSPDIF